MDEQEQLDTWWESLDADRRRALIDAEDAEPPGWAVASVVAMFSQPPDGAPTDGPPEAKGHLVTALIEFLRTKRSPAGE